MIITLVALLCSGPICVEKVITTSNLSDITMMSCQQRGQMGIALWMSQNVTYRDYQLHGWQCVSGPYIPKGDI